MINALRGRRKMGMIQGMMLALLAGLLAGCATAPQPEGPKQIVLTRPADYRVITQDWGSLTWFVSADQGNCGSMTVGQAMLKPGQSSPRHVHPNCDEVLHVIQGTIMHSLGDGKEAKMSAGDTITIPMGIAHSARNVGAEDAIMIISFSSAHRKVINE